MPALSMLAGEDLLFTHIQKTGGSYVTKVLMHLGLADWNTVCRSGQAHGRMENHGHQPLSCVPELLDGRTLLACVRHPLDWYVSYANHFGYAEPDADKRGLPHLNEFVSCSSQLRPSAENWKRLLRSMLDPQPHVSGDKYRMSLPGGGVSGHSHPVGEQCQARGYGLWSWMMDFMLGPGTFYYDPGRGPKCLRADGWGLEGEGPFVHLLRTHQLTEDLREFLDARGMLTGPRADRFNDVGPRNVSRKWAHDWRAWYDASDVSAVWARDGAYAEALGFTREGV